MQARFMPLAVLAAVAALAAAGCGDSDDGPETFENDDFAITFEYPGDLDEADEVEFAQSLGAKEKASAALGLDRQNAILLTRYSLAVEVTEANLDDAKVEVDRLIGQADPQAKGKRTEVGGFPALEYDNVEVTSVPGARSRLVFLFDGSDEYLINCQWKSDKREQIREACAEVLDTVQPAA